MIIIGFGKCYAVREDAGFEDRIMMFLLQIGMTSMHSKPWEGILTRGWRRFGSLAFQRRAWENFSRGFMALYERVQLKMGMKTFWHNDAKNDIPALRSALQKWGVDLESYCTSVSPL